MRKDSRKEARSGNEISVFVSQLERIFSLLSCLELLLEPGHHHLFPHTPQTT